MKFINYLFFLLFLLNGLAFSQTLQFRPSIGWGHGWGGSYKIETNDVNNSTDVKFDRPFNPNFQFPQIGFMLDYQYKNKLIISIGRMHGKTELTSYINDNKTYQAALIQKWGGEVIFSPFIYKNKFRLFLIGGVFYANNTNFNYNSGSTGFKVIDSSGNPISKSYDTSINIRKYGTMLNAGLRFAFYNQKNKEKFSVTINYDFGLNNLWTLQNVLEYNYLNNYTNAYSTSKGNQIKIYISKPINLYDFKRDGLNLF